MSRLLILQRYELGHYSAFVVAVRFQRLGFEEECACNYYIIFDAVGASASELVDAMIGENRQLVTDEPVEFKTTGKLPIILEEFIEINPNLMKEKPEDVNM